MIAAAASPIISWVSTNCFMSLSLISTRTCLERFLVATLESISGLCPSNSAVSGARGSYAPDLTWEKRAVMAESPCPRGDFMNLA